MTKTPPWLGFVKEIYRIWISERPGLLAAALAYFGVFSFAPVIFIAFKVAGIFIDQLALSNQVYERLAKVLGPEVTAFIQESVATVSKSTSSSSILIAVISFLALLFAASGLFFQIQYALNTIWKVPPPEKGETRKFITQRLFSFVMVIGVGLVLIIAAMAGLVLSWFGSTFNLNSTFPVINTLVFWGLVTLSFGVIYKFLPDKKVAWRHIWLGAAPAALLITLVGLILVAFFQFGNFHSAFAAAGAFTVLLIAMNFFAQIFLLGAVITRVSASRNEAIST